MHCLDCFSRVLPHGRGGSSTTILSLDTQVQNASCAESLYPSFGRYNSDMRMAERPVAV
ncbi:hypothetical protein BDV10DRAFT_169406 [Aspergillus recurvatus]